jgi:tetratricopeptide (TPR) repeat protein
MSDPLPTDPQRDLERAPEADREAKIEQLLLTGLEHYFAAEYDQAINVWTRALFLDRSHARARAYIERARTAQAERQRESEELLQDGVAALERGASREARRLLESALALGAPPDQALAALDRVTRLEQGQRTVAVEERRAGEPAAVRPRPSIAAWSMLGLLSAIIIGAAAFGAGAFRTDWRSLLQRPPSPSVLAVPPVEERLPLPRRGELALTRARTLAANGRLRDALVALEQVRSTDPQRIEADRLKIQIQQQLIELAGLPPQSGLKDAAQP